MLLHMVKCFESKELAHYEEIFDPLRDLQMVEQELLQMDLYKVETVLSEVEFILVANPHTETLVFQQETLVKVWEHIAGEIRPVPIPPTRKKGMKGLVVNRAKLPNHCSGLPVRLGNWDSQQREVILFCKVTPHALLLVLFY
jgi:ribosome-binding ATPase YchF (GTP1/OBG family)